MQNGNIKIIKETIIFPQVAKKNKNQFLQKRIEKIIKLMVL